MFALIAAINDLRAALNFLRDELAAAVAAERAEREQAAEMPEWML